MEAFIPNHLFNAIMRHAKQVWDAERSVNDLQIKKEFAFYSLSKAESLFEQLNQEQAALLKPLTEIKNEQDLEKFQESLTSYIYPFPSISEAQLKKMFKKTKKLHPPELTDEKRKQLTYLSWLDAGSMKKFMVYEYEGKLTALKGNFLPSQKKDICHFCNQVTDVGLFTVDVTINSKANTYKALSNYICQDAESCNAHLTNTEKLDYFVAYSQSAKK
ncbi:FusB/FusC family EF-G-binding protein [Listeria aquatica]|uniref:FusB/FusC family EF-G-binding protein n=1 Tax=Listeria aquatica TaxID=1494960 RepID=A0A841ZPR2_9LIST|nr:FusB/FusC family EF-G-binding protein [Listeria aquatica]